MCAIFVLLYLLKGSSEMFTRLPPCLLWMSCHCRTGVSKRRHARLLLRVPSATFLNYKYSIKHYTIIFISYNPVWCTINLNKASILVQSHIILILISQPLHVSTRNPGRYQVVTPKNRNFLNFSLTLAVEKISIYRRYDLMMTCVTGRIM